MKKESNLKRLLEYAGGYKYLTIASWILSALSALVALLPFVYIWKVIQEVLDVAPDYGDVQDLSHNGWMAVVFAVAAILIAAALVMTSGGVTNEFLLDLMYYIIITPIITLTLTKIMYASENKLIVADAMSRIDSILEMEPLPETDYPKHPKDNSVELSGVSFRYKDAERNALENISLTVRPGEHVALVGPSGGGKTTLASIVARFWDVRDGSVKIGGVNVKEIAKEELMDTVSFVFQDSKLLKTSILENVRMAKPDASRGEILKVLHDAQCNDILEKLPQGVDTVVGAKGVYLSGGEQQRISIARVMLKNAPVLVLDEATASLQLAQLPQTLIKWDFFKNIKTTKQIYNHA